MGGLWRTGTAIPAVLIALVGLLSSCRDDDPSESLPRPLFGYSVELDGARDLVGDLRRPWIVRVFNPGLPAPWRDLEARYGEAVLAVSFKADPVDVLGGAHDDELAAWFADAPTDRPTYWTYFHEPEDDIERGSYTAEQFRQAWEHVAAIAAGAEDADLVSTLVLMCWSTSAASGRDVSDYVTAESTVDVLAWDCYNHAWDRGAYVPVADLFERPTQVADSLDVDWAVAELGSRLVDGDDGSQRAEWLRSVAGYAREHDAAFVTYFQSRVGGDFVLTDPASVDAWSDVIAEAADLD